MGELFNRIQTQIRDFFSAMDNRKRIILGVSVAVVLLLIGLGVFFFTRPNYVVLMRSLKLEDAGAITAKLDEMQIPWKQENNNSTILVPEKLKDKALMNLAVGGFTSSGEITYEDVMGKSSITMTNEEKSRLYLLAQTTALSRAIKSLDGVEDAIVNLHVAQSSAFVIENDDTAKASVILKLRSGYKLKEEQVNGIVMILVNSVKGLKQENVTVTDSSGAILNQDKSDSENFAVSNEMEMTQLIQEKTRKRIQEFLATVYGNKNVEVTVNVALDFDANTSERIEFSPPIEGNTEGLVRSMTDLSETVENAQSGGAPGTDSNGTGTTSYPSTNSGQSTYKKANRTLNYELNQLKTSITKAKGQIKDLTIAVIVNKNALVGKEMTDDQKKEVLNLVAAAAGVDSKYIQVSAQTFAPDESVAISSDKKSGVPIWVFGIVAAVALAAIVGTVLFMRRRKQQIEEEIQEIMEAEELEEIDLDFKDKSSPKYQIEKYIDAKPDAVAQLLRSWINED